MTGGVRQAEPPGSPPDRVRIERPERLRVGAARVFQHEHHRQPLPNCEPARPLAQAEHLGQIPTLGLATERRRADEDRGLDRDARFLRHRCDRRHVGFHRPRRGVGGEREPGAGQLVGKQPGLRQHAGAGRRKADGHPGDAEIGHQVKQAELCFGRRIGDRRALEPVAQGLVVELGSRIRRGRSLAVPVVDQGAGHRSGARGARVADLVDERVPGNPFAAQLEGQLAAPRTHD